MLHLSYWSLISALFAVTSAQITLTSTNATIASSSSSIVIALENGGSMTPGTTVLPLTDQSRTDLTVSDFSLRVE